MIQPGSQANHKPGFWIESAVNTDWLTTFYWCELVVEGSFRIALVPNNSVSQQASHYTKKLQLFVSMCSNIF